MQPHKSSKKLFNISVLALIACLCAGANSSYGAENRLLRAMETDTSEQLAAFRQQIEDLEFEFGPYHASLVEPLQSMI